MKCPNCGGENLEDIGHYTFLYHGWHCKDCNYMFIMFESDWLKVKERGHENEVFS